MNRILLCSLKLMVCSLIFAESDNLKTHPETQQQDAYSLSAFVVGKDSTAAFDTIQSAIDAVAKIGEGTIFVRSGTYIENLNLMGIERAKVTILGAVALGDEGQCEIIGTHAPPRAGSVVFRNFRLTSDSSIFKSDDAGNAHLVLVDVFLNVKNGYSFDLPNWTGIFELFDVNPGTGNDGGVNNEGGATLLLFASGFGAGNKNSMIISGPIIVSGASIGCPMKAKKSASLSINNTSFFAPLITSEHASGMISNSQFQTGNSSAISHFLHLKTHLQELNEHYLHHHF